MLEVRIVKRGFCKLWVTPAKPTYSLAHATKSVGLKVCGGGGSVPSIIRTTTGVIVLTRMPRHQTGERLAFQILQPRE